MSETPPPPSPPAPHPAEWLPILAEAAALFLLALRAAGHDLLPGQLLPCLALGLAPGSAVRLLGRPSWGAHRLGLALGLVAFLVTNGTLRFGALLTVAARPDLLAAALGLLALQPLLGGWRWWVLLRAQGIDLSYSESVRLTLVGFFFNTFVPGATGGDLFRAYAIARDKGHVHSAVLSVVLDRFFGLPALLILVATAMALNWPFIQSHEQLQPLAYALLTACAVLGTIILALLLGGLWVGTTPINERWPAAVRTLLHALGAFRRHAGAVAIAMIVSLLSHIATVTAGICIGTAAGLGTIPASRFFLLMPIGLAVNAIPAAPGGLGQGEAAFAKLFALATLDPADGARGATIMLGLRAGLILVGLAGGLLYATGRHQFAAAMQDASEHGLEELLHDEVEPESKPA